MPSTSIPELSPFSIFKMVDSPVMTLVNAALRNHHAIWNIDQWRNTPIDLEVLIMWHIRIYQSFRRENPGIQVELPFELVDCIPIWHLRHLKVVFLIEFSHHQTYVLWVLAVLLLESTQPFAYRGFPVSIHTGNPKFANELYSTSKYVLIIFQIAALKKKFELKEKEFDLKLRGVEEMNRKSVNDLREMLNTQQKIGIQWVLRESVFFFQLLLNTLWNSH